MPRITQQQLESYLWGAATLLRGTIDAGDYKQFIFPLLFYKRLCDVFDEETQSALNESDGDVDYASGEEHHRFQVPSEAHWREVRQAAKNIGAKLHASMRLIETANPQKLYGIFGDACRPRRQSCWGGWGRWRSWLPMLLLHNPDDDGIVVLEAQGFTMSIEELEAAALKLEPKSRARLAELLLESLDQLSPEENARICVFRPL